MNPIIQFRNVKYKWPRQDHYLLQINDLRIKKGERVFIKGVSGSGKSTLLSLLSGLVVPLEGIIEILNADITTLNSAKRDMFRANHMGLIFQQFNLVPYLSVFDNIILPCRFSDIRLQKALTKSKTLKEETLRLLKQLGIDSSELVEKPVTELSVGQQQRVAAARALLGHPEILIADEPTSSLDSIHQKEFLDLLFEETTNSDTTLVYVSHDTRLTDNFNRIIDISEFKT